MGSDVLTVSLFSWSLQILDYLQQFMSVGQSESLAEAVPELLKNMLLVMSTSNVLKVSWRVGDGFGTFCLQLCFCWALQPPQSHETSASQQASRVLWDLTWTRVHAFLPGLHSELFPHIEAPTPLTGGASLTLGLGPEAAATEQLSPVVPVPTAAAAPGAVYLAGSYAPSMSSSLHQPRPEPTSRVDSLRTRSLGSPPMSPSDHTSETGPYVVVGRDLTAPAGAAPAAAVTATPTSTTTATTDGSALPRPPLPNLRQYDGPLHPHAIEL